MFSAGTQVFGISTWLNESSYHDYEEISRCSASGGGNWICSLSESAAAHLCSGRRRAVRLSGSADSSVSGYGDDWRRGVCDSLRHLPRRTSRGRLARLPATAWHRPPDDGSADHGVDSQRQGTHAWLPQDSRW